MKLIRQTRLIRRQKHVVHCEVDLCQLPGIIERFVINLRQGRAGEAWRDSTRTPQPVTRHVAESLYEEILRERRLQGFVGAAEDTGAASTAPGEEAGNITAAPALADTQATAQRQIHADLLARLQPPAWKALPKHQRTRAIWSIGVRRIDAAVPAMVGLLETGGALLDYCLAWAIGRCGDRGAMEAMRALQTRSDTDMVRRMAQLAWLQLADDDERSRHAEALVADWPAALRTAWATGEVTAIEAALAAASDWKSLSFAAWVEQLDQVALCQPLARRLLLAQARLLPARAGTFRTLRHLYKAAEFREDAELFGLLQQRFELAPPTSPDGKGWVVVNRKYVRYAEEVVRPDSRVAYSGTTREYLRRRGWRTLRRLGETGAPGFVAMASGVLLAAVDSDAGEWQIRTAYDGHQRHYSPYCHWMTFNRLLHTGEHWRSNRSGRTWYQLAPDITATIGKRSEAFPHLWDAQPDALLHLLRHSRCEGVHGFAARALSDNAGYCAGMPLATIRALLASPYTPTVKFAFDLCRQRFAAAAPDLEWLLLLLQAELPEARQFALDCISRAPSRYYEETLLVAVMLCSPHAEVRSHGRMLCQAVSASLGRAEAIALQLLEWLENSADLDDPAQAVEAAAADLVWAIDEPLRSAAARAPHERLLALLAHPQAGVRVLAGEWLLRHEQPLSLIPAATLAALLQHEDAQTCAIGVRLFGALPDHVLVAQPALFASFCCHPHEKVRRAIESALQRLAGHAGFCASLLPALLDCLFRAAPAEGVHADVLAWLQGPLRQAAEALDRDTVLRLLQARSKGASLLGARLLPRFEARDFAVRDWAALARNDNAAVRRWAFEAFRAHPELACASMEDTVRLLDSKWDDARAFSCEYLRSACAQQDWTPALLVSLCDHLDPAVQRFGREMLTTHFEVADVTEYLLKLSQHPSANMQLFVSNWLESAAAGDAECLQKLEPYFLAVLSQVNRARVVKNRVLTFLRDQATHSEAIAALVARLFARQVVTVAIADKAQYIEGLRAIQARYPALPAALTIAPPRRQGASGSQV